MISKNSNYQDDISAFSNLLKNIPTIWDGRQCILELKEADYNWKQMEWVGFYFEYKARQMLSEICEIPGERYGTVQFDLKKSINWDFKTKSLQSGSGVILNDTLAMQTSMMNHGAHGEIIALFDVEYNDDRRTFQQWHNELKGGISDYEIRRISRTASSRTRKTHARLREIVFLILREIDIENLTVMSQGRNSNDQPRPPKFQLNLDRLDRFQFTKLEFELE